MRAEALKHLQAALARAPGDAALLNDTGNALRALGRRAEAAQAFRRAIAADPRCADALFNLADTLLELDRPAEALDVYRAILDRAPDGHRRRLPQQPRRLPDGAGPGGGGAGRLPPALALDPRPCRGALAHAGRGAAARSAARVNPWTTCATPRARHGATLPLLLTLGQGLLDLRDLAPALEVFAEVLRRQPGHPTRADRPGARAVRPASP